MPDYTTPDNQSLVVISPLSHSVDDHGPYLQALTEYNHRLAKDIVDSFSHSDVRDSHDRTPLMYAVLKESLKAIDYLLSLRVNLLLRDIEGFTVLHRAAQVGNVTIIKKLLRYAEKHDFNLPQLIDLKSCRGFTALYSAAVLGHLSVVKYLMDQGASIHVKNHDGYTILMTLAIKGHKSIIELLLSQQYKRKKKQLVFKQN
jgi:26S proteasome non-ATPase regulatory subunit 10